MEQIKVTTLRKAITLLNACGFKYAIIDSDGEKHGELQVEAPRLRAKSEFPKGTLLAHILKYVPAEIKVGDVFQVPAGDFPKEKIHQIFNALC